MKTELNIKCKKCGHWNSIEVEKVLFNPDSPEPKVEIFIPSYLPYKEEKCSKCGAVIAEEKGLIRIVRASDAKT
jgi:hypothetical protein